jgi:hypothetical protein
VSDEDLRSVPPWRYRVRRRQSKTQLSNTARHSLTYFVEAQASGNQGSHDQQGDTNFDRGRNVRHFDLFVFVFVLSEVEIVRREENERKKKHVKILARSIIAVYSFVESIRKYCTRNWSWQFTRHKTKTENASTAV